jgi:hypothetical protein
VEWEFEWGRKGFCFLKKGDRPCPFFVLRERVDEDRLKWASETSDGIRVRGKKRGSDRIAGDGFGTDYFGL